MVDRFGCIGLWTLASILIIESFCVASDTASPQTLLARFRSIDWDKREVGQNKDLSDEAWKVRIEVENGLIALGKPAIPTLIEACHDSNAHVRLLAAYVLGCLNDPKATSALMRIVFSDPYAPARLMAVEALGRLGATAALPIVEGAMADKSPHVRNAAVWALPRVKNGESVGNSLREIVVSTFDSGKVASAIVGKPAPDFALMDDSGDMVRLSDFRSKKNVVIISLLADW
jgi:hypothetical protein